MKRSSRMGNDRRAENQKKSTAAEQRKCDVCCKNTFAESILACERCITVQHTFCLPNPLVALPDRGWLCPACRESSLRVYPSRRRRRSSDSSGASGRGGGAGGGRDGGRLQTYAFPDTSSGLSHVNGAVKIRTCPARSATGGGGDAAASAGAVANGATAGSAAPLGGKRRARKVTDKDGFPKRVGGPPEEADAAAGQDAAAPGEPRNVHAPSGTERESLDPGSTVTLFCRRDFGRYLRWKRRELASQDNEKRREEEMRARKTFSSIVASSS